MSAMADRRAVPAPWRGALRRRIGWLLLIKLLALIALWQLFFSAGHRVPVDPESAAAHIVKTWEGSE